MPTSLSYYLGAGSLGATIAMTFEDAELHNIRMLLATKPLGQIWADTETEIRQILAPAADPKAASFADRRTELETKINLLRGQQQDFQRQAAQATGSWDRQRLEAEANDSRTAAEKAERDLQTLIHNHQVALNSQRLGKEERVGKLVRFLAQVDFVCSYDSRDFSTRLNTKLQNGGLQ